MGLSSFGSGVIAGAEAFLSTSLALAPMRQKRSRKGGKDGKSNTAQRGPDRDKVKNKSQNNNKPQGFSGSGGNNGTANHGDNGRAQPRKKNKPFQQPEREKREDGGNTGAEESGNKHKGPEENPRWQMDGKASQESDETIIDVSLCSEASSENRVFRQSPPTEPASSPSDDNSSTYPHPTYLRPDFLDLLSAHARMCPPQPDPWGVKTEKFEAFYRRLLPAERMGDLGACIYVNVLTNGLRELHGSHLEQSKKVIWSKSALEIATHNRNLMASNLLRKGLPAYVSAFTQRIGPIGAERPAPISNRPMPHPNEVEHVVKSAKDLYKQQVGANDELQEIFLRQGHLKASNPSKIEILGSTFNKKTAGPSEPLHHQQLMNKISSTSVAGIAAARPTRDDRLYSGGQSSLGGLSSHQQQLALAVKEYQYSQNHAPLNAAAAFDIRRMFAPQAELTPTGRE